MPEGIFRRESPTSICDTPCWQRFEVSAPQSSVVLLLLVDTFDADEDSAGSLFSIIFCTRTETIIRCFVLVVNNRRVNSETILSFSLYAINFLGSIQNRIHIRCPRVHSCSLFIRRGRYRCYSDSFGCFIIYPVDGDCTTCFAASFP